MLFVQREGIVLGAFKESTVSLLYEKMNGLSLPDL